MPLAGWGAFQSLMGNVKVVLITIALIEIVLKREKEAERG